MFTNHLSTTNIVYPQVVLICVFGIKVILFRDQTCYKRLMSLINLFIDPVPRCQLQIMKQAESGFGYERSARPTMMTNNEIEDCKAICSKEISCVSIKYCKSTHKCSVFHEAPYKRASSSSLPKTCAIYVKSCGNPGINLV